MIFYVLIQKRNDRGGRFFLILHLWLTGSAGSEIWTSGYDDGVLEKDVRINYMLIPISSSSRGNPFRRQGLELYPILNVGINVFYILGLSIS